MTTETDSYSYSKNIPPINGGMFDCRSQNNDFLNAQKRSFSELNSDQWAQHMAIQAKAGQPRRLVPQVPHFEDPICKKTKLASEQAAVNASVLQNFNIYEQMMNGNINFPIQAPMNGVPLFANMQKIAKVIKVIPESTPYDVMFPAGKQSKMNQKIEEKLAKQNQFMQDSIQVKSEEDSDYCGDSTQSTSPSHSLEDMKSPQQAHHFEPLDKKDEKKLQKFLECYDSYAEKLALNDDKVKFKFEELARLVLPKLVSHFKSKPFESVAAAILLYACREVDHTITIKQIVSASDAKEKLINKCIFTIKEILPEDKAVKHFNAGEFIKVLSEKLGLDSNTGGAAFKIWVNIKNLKFSKSIHATTLAACCVSFACLLGTSERDFESIAVAAGITRMTLRNMYKELFPYRMYFITHDCGLRNPQDLKEL